MERASVSTRSATFTRRFHSRGVARSRVSTRISSPRRLRRKTDAKGSTVGECDRNKTMLPAGRAATARRSGSATSRVTTSTDAPGESARTAAT